VALETEALREAGLLIEDISTGPGGAQSGFVLPVARVRKIVKLDPEVKGLSKEGIQLITKASELFVAALGTSSVQVATLQNRRKIVPDDILQVCETKPNFMFLQEDIRNLIDEQKAEHKTNEKAKEEAKSKANSEASTGVKPLTSFFASSSVVRNATE
jgi:DNA-directed RNA polymerase I subunit RPA43